ncbi:chromogranin-A isoform X2 [Anolis carolinensis]|uniref:Chromogranin-A n=1 Tax=Anolis carolinensis TaxID=28377 RepID=G1KI85_ANOCA|nr:PREDICTED: chromogranin-A isoform X2 [Anolis carolinensis]|eukprot:XP_003214390.1 PREDICTED: chromogranin-A isoform X2 [Anolis carolinensis]
MTLGAFLAALLLAVQVISLPVTNPATQDDAKVMKCIAEVISDTVSKPNPLPISQECLDILQGDERIRSILRHQNLLRELQDIASQGADERTELEKKSHGFEDELSEVLETQSDGNTERELSPSEDPIASLAELEEAEKSQQNNERDISKEERNSLEERETRARDVETEDDKENPTGFESNEVGEAEELSWDDAAVDNHIHDDARDDEPPEQGGQEEEEDEEEEDGLGTDEFEEKEHASRQSQEESKEEREDSIRDQAEEEEEEEDQEEDEDERDADEEVEEEKERNTSEEEHPTSFEDIEDQREDDYQEAKGFAEDEKVAEEKERYHHVRGGRHHSLDDARQDKDASNSRDIESEEVEEDSRDLEDAKRWNKMDELAKQLTTTKRTEETESNEEDPDRSMKLALRSQKYDVRNSEDNERRPQKHHSKEESSEGGFPLVAMPEEKKDEEGSANPKTEDQELESLAAIEAELEKVAHKLHALRRG